MTGPGSNGAAGVGDVAARAAPGRSTILASELGGSLPCFRCGYNLKGLSIRAVCPECATPVKATLLAVVDPMASELRTIPRPRLTAAGLLLWSTAALGAALCTWAHEALASYATGAIAHSAAAALGLCIVGLTLASGLGAAALIRPHEGIRAGHRGAALLATLAYIPLVMLMWAIYGLGSGGPGGLLADGARQTGGLRLVGDALMIVIILGLRPNARTLAARSLLMRTGRVDRQTMLALVGVLVVAMIGEGAMLGAGMASLDAPVSQSVSLIGRVLVLVASLLFTGGLVGIALDCWRMRPVILESPRSLEGILGHADPHPPHDPHATHAPHTPRPQATS